MDAEATVRAYYDALRAGEPLYPFFAREGTTVKFGIGERLTGFEAIREGLAEQTETTDGWSVESDRLVVAERDEHAWFSDDVFMAWTDTERGIRYEFETRWSGTLERRDAAAGDEGVVAGTDWRFVGMHVSSEVPRTSNQSSGERKRGATDGSAAERTGSDSETRPEGASRNSERRPEEALSEATRESSDPRDEEGDT